MDRGAWRAVVHGVAKSRTRLKQLSTYLGRGFHGGSDSEESTCKAGDPGSVSGLGRSPVERNGNPLQYSCLKNSTDRGNW